MATPSHAQAVKSLNKSAGRRRFVFKTFSQRVEDIDIDVYRSLDKVKSEPSEGSSFFRDCLIEWRELNTAEDFISLYEETMPLAQTLPLVILQKNLIFEKLLSRLHMKARLSLEPILRLIAALSRDLLGDFLPFLPRITESFVSLLENGAAREPEIIEQMFTSWSYTMMYLQKYLVRDLVHVLKVSLKLRYYSKDYVQEFMAEAISLLFRNAHFEQLKKGIRKLLSDVVKKPVLARKNGASALLCYTIRGTSSRFHSKAELVLRLLMEDSTFSIGKDSNQGEDTVVDVIAEAFQRLCEEVNSKELSLMWKCLFEETTNAVTNGCFFHLCRLLSLLILTIGDDKWQKVPDYQPMLELVDLLLKTFVVPFDIVKADDLLHEVIDKVLRLILCILNGLQSSEDTSAITEFSLLWAPVFGLRNTSLLPFIRELLQKDTRVLNAFKTNILSTMNDLIEASPEEVTYLLLLFCERFQTEVRSSNCLEGLPEGLSRIHNSLQEVICHWIKEINNYIAPEDILSTEIHETNLALLWGSIMCYPHISFNSNPFLLMDLIDALDQLVMIESGHVAGFPKQTWQILIGAAMSSYLKLRSSEKLDVEETRKFLNLAKRHNSCPQVLLAVADYLDLMYRPTMEADTDTREYHHDLGAEKVVEAEQIFSDNLCHSDKRIRISTLRILSHYEPLSCKTSTRDPFIENEMETESSQTCHMDSHSSNVLQLLLSIDEAPISVATSRKVILLISKVQMALSTERISEAYVPLVLNGIIGIFHNRFSSLWDPASECLSLLISRHVRLVWDKFVCYFEQCQSVFETSCDQRYRENAETSDDPSDLVRSFHLFISPTSDCTPCGTLLKLLLQSLQKIPTVVESRSRQIVPLFFKFLGYNSAHLVSVCSFNSRSCKGKEWKSVLKEWLNLLKLMRTLKSFYQNQFLKEVLEKRLLDENDAEIQMKVLDCLLLWKDGYLLPYDEHLKNLISSKTLREELARWNLSKDYNLIDESHRAYVVPLVIRLLMPKVRKLKILASRKHAGVNYRKAVLGFISQLDVEELPLFFASLIKPLHIISEESDDTAPWFWTSHFSSLDEFTSINFLKYFSIDNITALSWKKRYGFLHVVEDVLVVFDEFHVWPFLDLLMGCVVRVLGSCTSILQMAKETVASANKSGCSANQSLHEKDKEIGYNIMTSTAVKQFKDLRSLCLKTISFVLNKYEDHEFKGEFWDMFFTSVKPLLDSFRQEVSSSEKPSSLFSCLFAMSKSYKLAVLLCRENNLIPDIFSILTVSSASEAIISFVIKFVENLLTLDDELDEHDTTKKILLPLNLDALVCNLHSLFKSESAKKRKLVKYPGETEIRVFKLLSKHIKDPLHARKFVDILLPLLEKRLHSSGLCVEAVQVIREVVPLLGNACTAKILKAASPLLVCAELEMRLIICNLIKTLAEVDPSIVFLAQLIHDLNATSAMEMGGLDFETIINTYEKINVEFFYTVAEDQALVLLSHVVYDMSSDELILRHSAYRALICFVEFSALILGQKAANRHEMIDEMTSSDDGFWTRSCILRMTNKFLLKHMGQAMNKGTSVKKEWINLLREMVLKIPEVANLDSLKALYSEDAEVDFFNNITHLQKHRRTRALTRLKNVISTGNISEIITKNVFVPLLFNMLFDVQEGKGEHIRVACIEALASISGHMEWNSYYALLNRCFREVTMHPDKQKVLLRLICFILDHFHFQENISYEGTSDIVDSSVANAHSNPVLINEMQTCLSKSVLPKIQKLMNYASDKVDVNANLAALKVLKLLPGDVMDSQLLSIIQHVANFLKNRLESIRDEARSALTACLKELGLEYLQVIVSVMRGILKRGFELHVLGYTLNFILSKFLSTPVCGKLDYCLEDLLSIVEKDILGDIAEEKEVDKIAFRMKETRKKKSFETLKLISQSVTFKSHGFKLLSPIAAHLRKHLTPRVKTRLEDMLNGIASGIENNPSVNQTDLFIFVYGLIEDGIKNENGQGENSPTAETNKHARSGASGGRRRVLRAESPCSHLIMVFALKVLHGHIKKVKFGKSDVQLLSMLDPFITLLGNCLTSKYEDVLSTSLRCLALLLRLPLPSLETQADKIKAVVFDIAQSSIDPNSPLMQSCLTILTVLLRSTKVTLSSDQLHLLIQFPLFVDLDKNPSFVALSLLKAIVSRKLVVPEIYDLATRVAELMVTSQVESIRKKCSKILLQFLLDYRLSDKRLQQHIDFLLSNLRYEHSTGREAVLEMLHTIIVKFPKSVVDELSQTLFIHLVVCLANDKDNNVRSMTGAVIKLLIGCISPRPLDSILEYSLSWYLGQKQQLWSAAAQVLGLLVEVLKSGFQRHIRSVLPAAQSMLQSAIDVVTDRQQKFSDATIPFWKEAYYSLVMLEKILHSFNELCFEKDLEDIWEKICEFLLHPHTWIHNISNRLIALYFAIATEASKGNPEKSFGTFFLTRPSRLFLIAVSLCSQLKFQPTDDAAGNLITQNLVFAICGMHSFMGKMENGDHLNFWSTLEKHEQGYFLKACQLLDPRKGRTMFLSLTSGLCDQNDEGHSVETRYLLVTNLLKQMGKIALHMDTSQMKIVFDSFRKFTSQIGGVDCQHYAFQILLPLYRVREGFAGKVVPDTMIQLAQEVSECIQKSLGIQNFILVYSQIRKNLKAKRDKRKQEEKLMAVVNPMRNAKRKLRIAAKTRANKKRKVLSMKMSKWIDFQR